MKLRLRKSDKLNNDKLDRITLMTAIIINLIETKLNPRFFSVGGFDFLCHLNLLGQFIFRLSAPQSYQLIQLTLKPINAN